MQNITINEDTLHYVAAFLERWNEKAPLSNPHKKAEKQMREVSNFMLDNLYAPMYIVIVRHNKK